MVAAYYSILPRTEKIVRCSKAVLAPKSSITYLTYRSWVVGKKKPGMAYTALLALKGIRP